MITPNKQNPMKEITISKITLNVGAGKNEELLKKGLKLLKKLSDEINPIETITNKRIPTWNLRPGLKIGCKVTIRRNTEQLLKKLLVAKERVLAVKNFDNNGNLSFGIPEYIDVEGLEYDPELKIIGFEVAVTLERPGFSIKNRRIRPAKIGKSHKITKDEAINFVTNKFGVQVQ
ncbi:MAG TPA: 50S ribosomal protein L5 [Candidatus Nanoarchaeia archaeon]|nr:50S ribosomal protein L5 [Candidatus Nanoarchaeia archaeon]